MSSTASLLQLWGVRFEKVWRTDGGKSETLSPTLRGALDGWFAPTTGVNADGHREILGLQVTSAEGGAGWLAFFRDRPPAAWSWSPAMPTAAEAIGVTPP
jgi:hypothetical protein